MFEVNTRFETVFFVGVAKVTFNKFNKFFRYNVMLKSCEKIKNNDNRWPLPSTIIIIIIIITAIIIVNK